MIKKLLGFFNSSDKRGLTLIEVLVTASLIVFISTLIIQNFSISVDALRAANVMASDIRLAQQLALSAHQFQGPGDPEPRNRCGYGITGRFGSGKYVIFAGAPTLTPAGLPNVCGPQKYVASPDYPIYRSIQIDSRLSFGGGGFGFEDIFFQPPGSATYINGSNVPSGDPWERIIIKKTGVLDADCDGGSPACAFICVYYSGRVEVSRNPVCPAAF